MVQTSPTPFDVGRAFVHQYYTLLHQAPHMLHRFYSTDSTFIHGGVDRPGCVEQPAVGPENISQRINNLNLRDCHAKIRQVDSHPTIGDGVVVQVTGELSNNGDPMRRFMQTFVLAPRQPKKYYVQNDIFRYQDEVFDDETDEDDRSSSHIYGDTGSNIDKVSNAGSSAAMVSTLSQPIPPRGNTQAVVNNQQSHASSNNINGFTNVNIGESTTYTSHGHAQHSQTSPRLQETQQQTNGSDLSRTQPVKQTTTNEGQRPVEGTSYAGIMKLHSSTGPTSNVNSSTATVVAAVNPQPNNIGRSSAKPSSTTTSRPTNSQQPASQRNSGVYHQPNNRVHNSGISVMTAPNEQQVFVGSLPLDFTRETLIECFSTFGKVLDAKIHSPAYDNKKNFGFVVFENPEIATEIVKKEHIMYNDTIRLNVEAKTQRNNNAGGNFNNGPSGGGRNSNYQGRGGSGRGGNRAPYRGSNSNNQRRSGQFNNNSSSLTGGDENNNEFRTGKLQQQQQVPQQ